jgi:cell wall-associated NlpC family hydrolase
LPNRAHGLRAAALAIAVALVGTAAIVPPVTATDPAPAESPAPSPSLSPSPSPSPAPDPTASPAESPSPAPDPMAPPAESPAPSAESPSSSPDPSSGTVPPASAEPAATPTPAPSPALATVTAPPPAVVPNIALRVVRIALAQRGDQYRLGSQGPSHFDCSGLVRYSYRQAGVSGKLGGGSSARGMLYWARLHGLTSPRNPRPGDVAIYGGGTHAAIWIGNGRVVHALNPRLDILVTRLHAVTKPFTTFIHTRIPRG